MDSPDCAQPLGAVPPLTRLVRLEHIILDEKSSPKKQLSSSSVRSCGGETFNFDEKSSPKKQLSSSSVRSCGGETFNFDQKPSPKKQLSSSSVRSCGGETFQHSMSTSSNASTSSIGSEVRSPTSSYSSYGVRVESDDGRQSSLEDSDDLAGVEETDYHHSPPIVREMVPDRLSPSVQLSFQPTSGGVVKIKDDKELDVVPPKTAKNFELEEITQIIFDQQEGGGLCVVFKSWEYKGCIIGYPRKGYIVKGNGQSDDHRTWWRLHFFRDVFQYSLPKYENSVLLQFWYGIHRCDPKDGLFFVIESGPNFRKYKLGPLHDARTMGAFHVDCVPH